MLQRYTGPYPLIFPTLDPVVEAIPGGDPIDYPTLLPGFEPVTAPDDVPDTGDDEEQPRAPLPDLPTGAVAADDEAVTEAGDGAAPAAPLTPEES